MNFVKLVLKRSTLPMKLLFILFIFAFCVRNGETSNYIQNKDDYLNFKSARLGVLVPYNSFNLDPHQQLHDFDFSFIDTAVEKQNSDSLEEEGKFYPSPNLSPYTNLQNSDFSSSETEEENNNNDSTEEEGILNITITEFPSNKSGPQINKEYWPYQKENLERMIETLGKKQKIKVNDKVILPPRQGGLHGIFHTIAGIYSWNKLNLVNSLKKMGLYQSTPKTDWNDKEIIQKLKKDVQSQKYNQECLTEKYKSDIQTIKNVCQKNGFPLENKKPRAKTIKLTSTEKEDIKKAYKNGISPKEIVAEKGVNRKRVREILSIPLNQPKKLWTEEEITKLKKLVKEKDNKWAVIGQELGKSKEAVRNKYRRIMKEQTPNKKIKK